MYFLLLITLLFFFLTLQILFWILQLSKVIFYRTPPQQAINSYPFITVLICIKNEYFNLKSNLQSIIDQDYEEFEILIVDDHSSDLSIKYLKDKYTKEPKLKILELGPNQKGKKNAILEAAKYAKSNIFLLTDADCRPHSSRWINEMVKSLGKEKDIVLGYTPYFSKPSFLNKFIRFETCMNGAQILSASILGFSYAGVGRNILYRRTLVSPEALQMAFLSGDDDLLINKVATKKNTIVCMDPDSFVYSIPKGFWIDYFKQRWRHYSTSTAYSIGSQFYLLGYFFSLIGFYGIMIICLVHKMALIALLAYFIRLLFVWPIFYGLCRRFRETGLFLLFPILELSYVLFICLQLPLLFIRKKSW